MTRAQINRDIKAIMTVVPSDGSAISIADIYQRAGEGLGEAIEELVASKKLKLSKIDHRHYLSRQ